jgi:hypothetical protein
MISPGRTFASTATRTVMDAILTMKEPFGVAKIINPNVNNIIEKKKLKEHDAVKKGDITYMPRSVLEKINQNRCLHENIDWDLKDGVEMLDKETISISIECTDCGRLGYGFFDFREIEWK